MKMKKKNKNKNKKKMKILILINKMIAKRTKYQKLIHRQKFKSRKNR